MRRCTEPEKVHNSTPVVSRMTTHHTNTQGLNVNFSRPDPALSNEKITENAPPLPDRQSSREKKQQNNVGSWNSGRLNLDQ